MPPVIVLDRAGSADLVGSLLCAGVERGEPVGLVVRPGMGLGVAARAGCWAARTDRPHELVAAIESRLRPRWVWWSARSTATVLIAGGVRVATCWDVATAHRLLAGGVVDGPGLVWATLHGLDPLAVPRTGQLDLLAPTGPDAPGGGAPGDPESPMAPDGHLRAEWVEGGWYRSPERLARWAQLALRCHHLQQEALSAVRPGRRAVVTAQIESAAELLCVELEQDGLPLDVGRAEQILVELAGPRPTSALHETQLRAARDQLLLRHVPTSSQHDRIDLRNPAHVRVALAAVGIALPDTRSWRLETWRGQHPLVDALIAWRKADRLVTTFGHGWLDTQVGADGRLRGQWSSSDGAAGRMTAQAGLHNLPTELRPAVAAEPGHALVRADLGQIEPRVLAGVSADPTLAQATRDDDLYLPVARRLGVDRAVAKVAVLAAMYGQTSGTAGQALTGLDAAYPVAMAFLRAADDDGRAGRHRRTHGGRLVRMPPLAPTGDQSALRTAAAGRGRFARNAVVQGAAAELFKAWAVTVRAGLRGTGATIVLCLHDELLVHAPHGATADVQALLGQALQDVGARWADGSGVRFVADVSALSRWSEAK